MAGLIKKQILKILTKFTDGLTPDDIQEKIREADVIQSMMVEAQSPLMRSFL